MPEKWTGFGEKSIKSETDKVSLEDRIQKLLSYNPEPLKADKHASHNIQKPKGAVARKLKAGHFDPRFKGVVGSLNVEGYGYYHSFLNIEGNPLKDKQIHLYGDGVYSYDPDDRNASYIVHSHSQEEYCPYRAGCHVALILYPTGWEILPNHFKEQWFNLYERIFNAHTSSFNLDERSS